MPHPETLPQGQVLDALDTGVLVLDRDGRIAVWNEWMAAASRTSPHDALGKTLEDLFADTLPPRLGSAVREALEAGASSVLSQALHRRRLPLFTRAGLPLIHNIAVRPIGDPSDRCCLVQVFDVTAATERENVLRSRQNARYDAVVESAPDPILTLDQAGIVQLANPAAARELGFGPLELIGRPLEAHIEDPSAWRAAFHAVLHGERVAWPVELVARRKDGTRSFLDASASRWSSGSGVFVTTILRDVNDRRLAEANLREMNDTLEERVRERTTELERAHEQLRQSQKVEAIGQLTGGIAHDFNNLLTPILGGLDILRRRWVGDERGQRLLDGALQSAERARVLVQRLLAFARRQPLQPTAVDLAGLVHDMSELVGSTLGPRIRIVEDVEDDLPPARADHNQLEMALLNLAVNARDAMPDGGTLTICAHKATVQNGSELRPGPYVTLAVVDTGSGMDADTVRRAVEPFFSTKGIGKGTGLGLSMIHGLAAQLGGKLEIASTPGVGTRVEIWLPAADDKGKDVGEAPAGNLDDFGAGVVLLVEDEDLIRTSTAQMLADLGYSVIETASAQEALPHLGDRHLVMLVTDHLMPGMTGTELAREAQSQRPSLPILIISGYAELEDVAPDLPRLTKPFRETELAAALAGLRTHSAVAS